EASPPTSSVLRSLLDAPHLVGRAAELQQLHQLLDKALRGERQLVFVTGEPGIGKTTLIDAFVSEVLSPRSDTHRQEERQKAKISTFSPAPVLIGRGQCLATCTAPVSLTCLYSKL